VASAEPLQSAAVWSVWDSFVRAQAVALPYVHRRLHEEHGLTLSEFLVLQQAAAAEPATMTQLQQGAAMSASGITRVVGALVARGLVVPLPSGRDRRLRRVEPTTAGRQLLGAARTTTEAAFTALLPENLGEQESALLARVLENLGNRALIRLSEQ
jgi:DNA-binding MarR family transcriptional regulator